MSRCSRKTNITREVKNEDDEKQVIDQSIVIFCSYSTRNSSSDIYKSFIETLPKNGKYTVKDPNKNLSSYCLAEEIIIQINESDIMIADITPDFYRDEEYTEKKDGKEITSVKREYAFNPHVMCELQHASSVIGAEHIMIICVKNIIKNRSDIPIFFNPRQTIEYESNDEALGLMGDFIGSFKIYEYPRYRFRHLDLVKNEAILDMINMVVTCRILRIDICYDNAIKDIVLFCHHVKGLHGKIDLQTMQYIIKSKNQDDKNLTLWDALTDKLEAVRQVALIKLGMRK